jgi:hypothetical protein
MSLTSEGALRIVDTTDASRTVSTSPLYKPTNASEAPFTLRLTASGALSISDEGETERFSYASNADGFVLTDKAELLLRRSGADFYALHPSALTVLRTGESMYRNQRIRSPDGSHELIFQNDGNLVLYQVAKPGVSGGGATVRWASNTDRADPTSLDLQPDGNLVMYGSSGWRGRGAVWASNTVDDSKSGQIRELQVRNDGAPILVENGKVIKDIR